MKVVFEDKAITTLDQMPYSVIATSITITNNAIIIILNMVIVLYLVEKIIPF